MLPSVEDDIAIIASIDCIPSILEIVCTATGLRFAAVARVTEARWTACAVRDEIDFGLQAGDDLDLKTTICDEIRDHGEGVIIDHVAESDRFRDHHTPAMYGFQSYISVPIVWDDGTFFGTLCALDPLPAKLSNPATIATFESFAKLIGRQLTAQYALEKTQTVLATAMRENTLREQFIAILGHDLRNPLAAIQAGIHLLGKQQQTDRALALLGQMQLSCHRMDRLIRDVLDFARGRLGGGLSLTTIPADNLGTSIAQVISELQIVHPERDIRLHMDIAATVDCDVARIMQLFSNLLANALTHGDAVAPIHVVVESEPAEFRISVENQGETIPQEALDTLFEPFTQTAESNSANGLGLGLYIANEIAKAHHGSLDVASRDGTTKFTLTMPCHGAPG